MTGGRNSGRIDGGDPRSNVRSIDAERHTERHHTERHPTDTPAEAEASGERGRVIPFVPRPGHPGPHGSRLAAPPAPVADLSAYEGGDEPDDYGQRMVANLMAFLLLALLTAGGLWIASTMADQRKSQDCVLSGRPGCTPVPLKAPAGQ